MQPRRRLGIGAAAALAVGSSLVLLPASPAEAHGSMSNPPSRTYICRNEGPENPKSEACKAAIAAGGTQAFYDWHEVSRLDAGGRHREIIPDGQLCGAGRDKYRGLNLTRTDWPATRVSAGPLRITYHATAPHANSNFEFYITRAGWNPSQPLRWSDLVHIQTFTNQNPTTFTNWTINLPQRSGRHLIYSIWQRVVGSEEAFYTCSDVDFGGGNADPNLTSTVTGATHDDHSAITTHEEHRFNDQDVMFLQMMVAHNGEGVRLSRLVAGRPVREEVRTLVAAMAATQKGEAKTMAGWLTDRDRPPTAAPDEHTAHGGMPGTSPEEIAAVENATGPVFERKLLDLLIAHQDDAVQMARAEVAAGIDPEITELARRVDTARTAQIATMLTLRQGDVPLRTTPEASGAA